MRPALLLFILFVFVGCNSEEAGLTSIQGLRDPKNPIPKIVSILPQTPGTYTVGSNLDFYVTYDDVVIVDGIPRLPLILDSGIYYANYVSGAGTNVLYFQLTVPAGAYDYNGIQMSGSVNLNGGSIYDPDDDDDSQLTYSPPSTSGILINGINPLISSITIDNGNYKIGDMLEFTVNYTYPVYVTGTPRLPITVNVTPREAIYVSGSGTSQLKFTYNVDSEEDYNGIVTGTALTTAGATIVDYFGDPAALTFTSTNFTNVIVDGITPAENSRIAPMDNPIRVINSILTYGINYKEKVNVTGTPRIPIIIGTTTRYANYLNGSGDNTIFFQYTVQAGELDTNGIVTVTSVDLNGGTIEDRAGNPISATFLPWPPHTVNVDAINPAVTSVSINNGNYKIGDTILVHAYFSESVNVTGVPSITLDIGGVFKQAAYLNGTGSNDLTFKYIVEEGLLDSNGVAISGPISLNGGTIRDAATNDSVVAFASFSNPSALVDAVRPTMSLTSIPTVAPYAVWRPGNTMAFTVTASENLVVSGGTPAIGLTIGVSGKSATMSSTSANIMNFSYTVAGGDLDLDGITLSNASLILNGSNVRDSFGNDAVLSLGAMDMSRVYVMPEEIKFWFDLNDPLTTTGTTSATTLKSKSPSGTTPFLTGAPPALVAGPNGTKFAQFTGTNNFTMTTTADVVITTVKTPTANGTVWRTQDSTRRIAFDYIFLGISTVYTGAYCNSWCYFYQPSMMYTVSVANAFSPYSFTQDQYRTIAVDYRTASSTTYKIGEFNGQIGEMFVLSGTVSTALIQKIGDYLNTKHGAAW